MTANNDDKEEEEDAPTMYTIRFEEYPKRSWYWWWPLAITPLLDVAMKYTEIAACYYWNIPADKAVHIVTALLCVILCHRLYSSPKTEEVSLEILPLGVQRSKTTTYNSHKAASVHYYPLLSIESVKDCIILEHVGTFTVSTHVMLRLQKDSSCDNVSGMLAAFPDANLTFDQCHGLVNQINDALEEVQ